MNLRPKEKHQQNHSAYIALIRRARRQPGDGRKKKLQRAARHAFGYHHTLRQIERQRAGLSSRINQNQNQNAKEQSRFATHTTDCLNVKECSSASSTLGSLKGKTEKGGCQRKEG
jgi:hypothetical protein